MREFGLSGNELRLSGNQGSVGTAKWDPYRLLELLGPLHHTRRHQVVLLSASGRPQRVPQLPSVRNKSVWEYSQVPMCSAHWDPHVRMKSHEITHASTARRGLGMRAFAHLFDRS